MSTFQWPKKIALARIPTPIQPMPALSHALGVDLRIKRDDLTGCELTGNKIRKLEYLLADARRLGCDTVITCGAVTSNHARATALAARRLGFNCHLVLAGDEPAVPQGNLLLDLLAGAEVRYISRKEYTLNIGPIMHDWADELRSQGFTPYVIPTGGSNPVGLLGYVQAAQEIAQQNQASGWKPDLVACAVGSGGTYAGLVAGNALFSAATHVMGVLVCSTIKHFTDKVLNDWQEAHSQFEGLGASQPQAVQLVDGYIAGGYGKTNPEQLNFLRHVAQTEAIVLDPVYTNKALYGLVQQIKQGRIEKSSRILFVHTGGIFGLSAFAQEMTQFWGKLHNGQGDSIDVSG